MPTIDLMLFVNNPSSGRFMGQVDAIDIGIGDGMKLEGHPLKCSLSGDGRRQRKLRIGQIVVRAIGYSTWVGNWCWDKVTVSVEDAVKAINYLRCKGWDCLEAESRMFNAWQHGIDVTKDQLLKWCR